MPHAPTTTPLLTEAEAALVLHVSALTLRGWRTRKRQLLPYIKLGRAVRYRQSDLDAFIQKHTQGEG